MPKVTDFSRFITMGVALSTCIMKIVRILYSGRKRRSADLTPMVQALFFLVGDLGGCIIVTIELLNPHQCSVVQRARFLYPYIYAELMIYMRSSCGRSPQERTVVPAKSPVWRRSGFVVSPHAHESGFWYGQGREQGGYFAVNYFGSMTLSPLI